MEIERIAKAVNHQRQQLKESVSVYDIDERQIRPALEESLRALEFAANTVMNVADEVQKIVRRRGS